MKHKREEVRLLCEPTDTVRAVAPHMCTNLHDFVFLGLLAVVVACIFVLVIFLMTWGHLGASERDSVLRSKKAASTAGEYGSVPGTGDVLEILELPSSVEYFNASSTYQVVGEILMEIDEEKMEVEKEEEDDDVDEMKGLQENIGEDPTDPKAVAFLLPLRGHVGDLGLKLGRRLKRIMEKSVKWSREEDKDSGENSSRLLPSSILVRDSQSDPEITRSLTQHFYEEHGVTRYFGLLTDEEAMTVAHWARAQAPGTRYVTPTATSILLEWARNVAMVQPPASMLAAAVADLLLTVQIQQPLIVARASLHTDTFLVILRSAGIRPQKVLRYYSTTNMTELAGRVQRQLLLTPTPVLLLGNSESWHLVEAADHLFSAIWILPFPTQLNDHMRTKQSELLTFMYRTHDDAPGTFLQEEPLLAPTDSIIVASQQLLSGGQRQWHGAYVVAASVAVNSVVAGISLLGITDGWLPLLQYDISAVGIIRRMYQELLVTKDLLKPLLSGEGCNMVIRYQEELTGLIRVREVPVHSLLPTLLVPAERGAQVHVDCHRQHADLRCTAPSGAWAPVTCQGTLQGRHVFMRECGQEIGISISASQGCTGARGLVCRGGNSLGCLLSGLCTSLTHPVSPIYHCAGLNLDTLNFEF